MGGGNHEPKATGSKPKGGAFKPLAAAAAAAPATEPAPVLAPDAAALAAIFGDDSAAPFPTPARRKAALPLWVWGAVALGLYWALKHGRKGLSVRA